MLERPARCRREPAQRWVRPVVIVVVSPAPEDLSHMSETVEHFFVEAFVAQLAGAI